MCKTPFFQDLWYWNICSSFLYWVIFLFLSRIKSYLLFSEGFIVCVEISNMILTLFRIRISSLFRLNISNICHHIRPHTFIQFPLDILLSYSLAFWYSMTDSIIFSNIMHNFEMLTSSTFTFAQFAVPHSEQLLIIFNLLSSNNLLWSIFTLFL